MLLKGSKINMKFYKNLQFLEILKLIISKIIYKLDKNLLIKKSTKFIDKYNNKNLDNYL